MKLMTKGIAAKIPMLYSTETTPTGDKVAICKFFDPCGRGTWYVVEGEYQDIDGSHRPLTALDWKRFDAKSAASVGGSVRFFGYVVSPLGRDCDEWGYFNLDELESIKGRMGVEIERDRFFEPKVMGEIIDALEHSEAI